MAVVEGVGQIRILKLVRLEVPVMAEAVAEAAVKTDNLRRSLMVETIKWKNLWHIHEGKTILCLCSGPSANAVDLDTVEKDFTIGTNYITKKYDCDYQISCDSWNWKEPMKTKHYSKLLIAYVSDGGKVQALKKGGAYCAFPHLHKFGWGNIEQGAPLPTAFNSGISAIAMAAYMGAKVIKVLGLDFHADTDDNFHAYSEDAKYIKEYTPEETIQIYTDGDLLSRVKPLLLRLSFYLHMQGITIQNLSPSYEKSPLIFNLFEYLKETGYKNPNVCEKS